MLRLNSFTIQFWGGCLLLLIQMFGFSTDGAPISTTPLLPANDVKVQCVETSAANITVPLGSTVVLNCSITPNCATKTTDVMWLKTLAGQWVVLRNTSTIEGKVGHISIEGNQAVEQRLRITNVTEQDQGVYDCQAKVNKYLKEIYRTSIYLNVMKFDSGQFTKANAIFPTSPTILTTLSNSDGTISSSTSEMGTLPTSATTKGTAKNGGGIPSWIQTLGISVVLVLLLILDIIVAAYLLSLISGQDNKQGNNNEESIDMGPDQTDDDLLGGQLQKKMPYIADGIDLRDQAALQRIHSLGYSHMSEQLVPPHTTHSFMHRDAATTSSMAGNSSTSFISPVDAQQLPQQQQQPDYFNTVYMNSDQLLHQQQNQQSLHRAPTVIKEEEEKEEDEYF